MAGPTTAERGDRRASLSGPPPPVRRVRRGPRLPRRRGLVLAALVAVLLGAGCAWLLYGSGLLRAERVTVIGTGVLTPDQVRTAAAVPLDAPLVSVDTQEIESRLRSRLPRISGATVTRSWPHTIVLKVTERQPEAIVERDRKFVEVDAEGVLFATVTTPPDDVPLLEMDLDGSASSRRFGATRLRRAAVQAVTDLPTAVRRDTRALRVRSYDSITIELTGGRTVVWGSGERGAAKARTLTALMKAEPDANHFDVSAPSAPAAARG